MMTIKGHTVIAGRPVNIGSHTDPLMQGTLIKRQSGFRREDFDAPGSEWIYWTVTALIWIVLVGAVLSIE